MKAIKFISTIIAVILSLIFSAVLSITANAQTFESLAAIEKQAGFEINVPEGVDEIDAAFDNGRITVRYTGASGEEISISKSRADDDSENEAFNAQLTEEIDGCEVQLRGTCSGYYRASWRSGNYSYTVSSDCSMSLEEMENMVSSLM